MKIKTTAEAAKMLGVSPARVRQFVLAGRIKAQKLGRDLLITEKEINRFNRTDRDRRRRS